MAGFENDVGFSKNFDFTQSDNQAPTEANGLATNGQLWIGRTAVNAGGTHIDVNTLTAGTGVTITNGPGTITIGLAGGEEAVQHLTGNTGGQLNPDASQNFNIVTADSTVVFAGSGSTLTQDFGISNLMLGSSGPSITTAANNTSFGNGALNGVSTGTQSTAVGFNAMNTANSSFSTAIGAQALPVATGASNTVVGAGSATLLSTAAFATVVGFGSLTAALSGNRNSVFGANSGTAYTGGENNNLILGEGVTGTLGESRVTRIGNASQTACFISGIDGVNVGSVAKVVTETSNQLGTATITAGTGITVTPTANTITIAASSGGFTWSDISGAFSPLAQNGYFITGTATGTLPASPAQGDTIQFFVDHATQVLTIDAPGTQIIRFGSLVTAAGGTAVSTLQGDSCELVYRTADTCWCAVDFVGTWTLT